MIILLILFPVLLFSQKTCVKIDFHDSYIMETKVKMDFRFKNKYLEVLYNGNLYYYKIKKKIVKGNYSIYWINSYKMYVYPEFILQNKSKYITIYKLCSRNIKL